MTIHVLCHLRISAPAAVTTKSEDRPRPIGR